MKLGTNMTARAQKMAGLALLVVLPAGCMTRPRAYVDPTLPDVQYGDIRPVESAQPLHVDFEFQTNGVTKPELSRSIGERVIHVLRLTGLFSEFPADEAGVASLYLVMNNVADVGKAVAKGIGTGMTFGVVGTQVTDAYEFTATFNPPSGTPILKKYVHAIHTTIGKAGIPQGLRATSHDDAMIMVVEDVTLSLLRDLQAMKHLVGGPGS
jgi:hypothetical protein